VSFSGVTGYFKPQTQTLTLAPGGTIHFIGVYKRLLLVLFTGYSNGPNSPSGLKDLLSEITNTPALAPGSVGKVFTFYNEGDGSPYRAPSTESLHLQATQWLLAQRPGSWDKIVIIGHSYGGNRARVFVKNDLAAFGSIEALVTIDPIDWMSCSILDVVTRLYCGRCNQEDAPFDKPRNVARLLSFTQTTGIDVRGVSVFPCVHGYHFFDPILGQFTFTLLPVDHLSIDGDASVHASIRQLLLDIIRSN